MQLQNYSYSMQSFVQACGMLHVTCYTYMHVACVGTFVGMSARSGLVMLSVSCGVTNPIHNTSTESEASAQPVTKMRITWKNPTPTESSASSMLTDLFVELRRGVSSSGYGGGLESCLPSLLGKDMALS